MKLFQIPIIALFCSANWCPPCKGMIPILDKFVNKVNEMDFEFGQDGITKFNYLYPQNLEFVRDQENFNLEKQKL